MLSSDQQMERQVKQVLSEDSRVDPKELSVGVENGVVHLEGSVDSAAERRAVREDVETVPGVIEVRDDLRLRNFIERTDEELEEEVRHNLLRDPYVDVPGIKVTAHGGEVVLEGVVDTFAEKNAAENVAWWTAGVVNVISRLRMEEDIFEEEPAW